MFTLICMMFLLVSSMFEFFRVAVLFTERTATEHLLALPEPAVSSEA